MLKLFHRKIESLFKNIKSSRKKEHHISKNRAETISGEN